jgi:Bacterial pullanase-associated domain
VTVAGAAQDLVEFVERWVSTADVADWVLLATGIALFVVAGLLLAGEVRLGTVEVSATKEDGLDGKQLAAFREELARCGLLPRGGVPAGTPKANVVAAIEKAPLPQASWVGALVNLIPSIPSSRSFGLKASGSGDVAHPGRFGVTLQISQQSAATSLGIRTVTRDDGPTAIDAAAREAFREIAESAPSIFPLWSLWPDERSFMKYREGIECEKSHRPDVAFDCFQTAESLAPRNLLAKLCVANRLELQVTGPPDQRITQRIAALDAYLKINKLEPSLFQAHYRAMALLSVLADSWSTAGAGPDAALSPAVVLAGRTLRKAAFKEARAASRLLGATWTIRHEGRLRNRLELRGTARRRADKAVATARETLRLRQQWPGSGPIPWGLKAAQRYWWRVRMRVRFAFLREGLGWQAHYNAACFYACLPETSASPGYSDTAWLRARAFRHLGRAFGDPAADIDPTYARHDDPALGSLRTLGKPGRTSWDEVAGREAVIHYHIPGAPSDAYWHWQLHLWGPGVRAIAWTVWSMGRDPSQVKNGCADYWIPIGDARFPICFVVHNGDTKDAGDRELAVSAAYPEAWLIAGDPTVYVARPPGWPT